MNNFRLNNHLDILVEGGVSLALWISGELVLMARDARGNPKAPPRPAGHFQRLQIEMQVQAQCEGMTLLSNNVIARRAISNYINLDE